MARKALPHPLNRLDCTGVTSKPIGSQRADPRANARLLSVKPFVTLNYKAVDALEKSVTARPDLLPKVTKYAPGVTPFRYLW